MEYYNSGPKKGHCSLLNSISKENLSFITLRFNEEGIEKQRLMIS